MPTAPARFAPLGHAPAGAGLPEYMPGQPESRVPRGTDKRVLPPTREPGIWASDKRREAAPRHAGPLTIEGVMLPVPEVSTEVEAGNYGTCKWVIPEVFNANSGALRDMLGNLSDENRTCAIVWAWDFCMRVYWGDNQAQWDASERLRAETFKPFDKLCRKRRPYDFMSKYEDLLKEWIHGGGARH